MAEKQTFHKFAISLPDNMMTELEAMRIQEGRSRSEILREALRVYLHARKSTPMFGIGGIGVPLPERQES